MGTARLYKGIDVMKFLMAFIVVAIHTTTSNLLGLRDIAVPFFFVASGFFLFKKLDLCTPEEEVVYQKKWLLRVLRIYLVWTVIYMPFTIYGLLQDGHPFLTSAAIFFRNFIFIGENYLSWQLWYLLGMIWAGCIVFIFRKLKVSVWAMLLIGIALTPIAQIMDLKSMWLYHALFKVTRNGIFIGFPFMAAGGLIARFDTRLFNPIVWLFVSIVFLVFTRFASWMNSFTAVALFLFAASIKDIGFISDSVSCIIRKSSTIIYLSHMVFAGSLIICGMELGFVLFFIAAMCSLILSLLLCRPGSERVVKILIQ